MSFQYHYENKAANFGPPLPTQVPGGAHITFEIIPKHKGKYIALRRPRGIPNHGLPPHAKDHPEGLLFFIHDLIQYGESVKKYLRRVVRTQAGVGVKNFGVVAIDSFVQDKDDNWAFMPYVIAEVNDLPKTSNQVTEVVVFDKKSVPDGFAWWTKKEIEEFLAKYD